MSQGVGNLGDGREEFALLPEEDRGPAFYHKAGTIAAERGVVVDVVAITGEGAALEHLGSLAAAANGEIRTVGPGELAEEVEVIMESEVLALNAHVTTVVNSHLAFGNAEGWGWTTAAGNRAVAEAAAEAAGGPGGEAAGSEAAEGAAVRGGPLYGRLMPALPDDEPTLGDGTGLHRVVSCRPLGDPRLLPPAPGAAKPEGDGKKASEVDEDPSAASGEGAGLGPEAAPSASTGDPAPAAPAVAADGLTADPADPATDDGADSAVDGSSRVWRTPGNVVSGTELTLEFGRRGQALPPTLTEVPFQMQLWFSRPGDGRRILRLVTSMCPVSSDIDDAASPANVVAPVVAAYARAKTAQLAALGDYSRSRTTSRAYSRFLAQNAVMLAPECPPAPRRASRQQKQKKRSGAMLLGAAGRTMARGSRMVARGGGGISAPGAIFGHSAETPASTGMLLEEESAVPAAAELEAGSAMLMQWAQGLDGLDGAIAEELDAEQEAGLEFANFSVGAGAGAGRGADDVDDSDGDDDDLFAPTAAICSAAPALGGSRPMAKSLALGRFAAASAHGGPAPPPSASPAWAMTTVSQGRQEAERMGVRSSRRAQNDALSSMLQNSVRRGGTARDYAVFGAPPAPGAPPTRGGAAAPKGAGGSK